MRVAPGTGACSYGISILPRVPRILLRIVVTCLLRASTTEMALPKGEVIDASANGLLAALPEASRERLFAKTQIVSLSVGDILYHPGRPITSVYFPLSCVISM